MKSWGGVEIYLHILLNLALDADNFLDSLSVFQARKTAPNDHYIYGWMGQE